MSLHSGPHKVHTITKSSKDELAAAGAAWMIEQLQAAIKARGAAVMGLSGGSTPGPIYTMLGESSEVDWSKVTVFLVDDRHIPADHKDSNINLVNTTLRKTGTPGAASTAVFPDPSGSHADNVAGYNAAITKLFSKVGVPDVMTLGMGPDGHLASLFPPVSPAHLTDKDVSVVGTTTETFAVKERISLTMPAITSGRAFVFFLNGASKVTLWNEMTKAAVDNARWPAHAVLATGRTTVIANNK